MLEDTLAEVETAQEAEHIMCDQNSGSAALLPMWRHCGGMQEVSDRAMM